MKPLCAPSPGALQTQAPLEETGPAERPRPIDSRSLLGGGRQVEIAHEGRVYRLQATRLGKLILTK